MTPDDATSESNRLYLAFVALTAFIVGAFLIRGLFLPRGHAHHHPHPVLPATLR